MTAEEARRKSKEGHYTIEKFKKDMNHHLDGKSENVMPGVFMTPIGVFYSESFLQDVMNLGYTIRQKEDMMGIPFYLISW